MAIKPPAALPARPIIVVSPRAFWGVFSFMLLVALGLRLMPLDRSLEIDETGSIAQATAGDFWAQARQDVHPPLFHVLLRAGLRLTDSVPVLRLFSVACSLGLIALAMLSLRSRPVAAWIVGALLTALPEIVHHAVELRPYALLFLLLGGALAIAARGMERALRPGEKIGLGFLLALAAATHLIAAFFLLALVPLLAFPGGRRDFRSVIGALLPLVPAGFLLLWFKFSFVVQPHALQEGWWMAPAGAAQITGALVELAGWHSVGWLADAASRHLAGSGALILLVAGIAPVLAAWTARGGARDVRARRLLLAGLVHVGALICYSLLFESLVMARTLLPALLPLGAAVGLGIALQPRAWQRDAAAIALIVYLAFAAAADARRALKPPGGLRELTAATRTHYRTGDEIVLFRALDYGLRPYWPDLPALAPLYINQTREIAPQLAELRARLDRRPRTARVLVAFRDDYYLQQHREALDAVTAELAQRGLAVAEAWHGGDLTLLQATPTP
jgi:hypothetical protein